MTIMPFVIIMALVVNISMSLADLEMQTLSYGVFAIVMGSLIPIIVLYLYKRNMTHYGLLHFLYMFLLMSITLLYEADIKNALYDALKIWLLLIIIYYYRDRMKMLLVCFCIAFSFCVYANLLHLIANPDKWLVADDKELIGFLLGNNYNQMGCRMMAALVVSVMCVKYSKLWVLNLIGVSIACIAALVMVGCKTSLACVVIFLLFCLIPSVKIKKFGLIATAVVILLFQFFVVFSGKGLENNDLAVYIVVDVLEKDITFTNRTEMWDAAMRLFLRSPLWGWGFVELDWLRHNMSSAATGPHNQILSVLIYGGVLLLSLYVSICYMAIKRIIKYDTHQSLCLLFGIVMLMFIGLMEMFPMIFIFFILALAYYFPYYNYTSVSLSSTSNLSKENR